MGLPMKISVDIAVFVTFWTVRLLALPRLFTGIATANVLPMGYGLQVIRVDARFQATSVVRLHSGRDRPLKQFVGQAMSFVAFAADHNGSIPVAIVCSSPQPATGIWLR